MRKLAFGGILLLVLAALAAAVALPPQISRWKDREERSVIHVRPIPQEAHRSLTISRKMRLIWNQMSGPDTEGRREALPLSPEEDDPLFARAAEALHAELAHWQAGGLLPEDLETASFSSTGGRVVRYYDAAGRLQMTTWELSAQDPGGNTAWMVLDEETGRSLQAEIRLAQGTFPSGTPQELGTWYFGSLELPAESAAVSEETAWFALPEVDLIYRITRQEDAEQLSLAPVGLLHQIWPEREI